MKYIDGNIHIKIHLYLLLPLFIISMVIDFLFLPMFIIIFVSNYFLSITSLKNPLKRRKDKMVYAVGGITTLLLIVALFKAMY